MATMLVDGVSSLSAEDGYARLHDAIISGRLQPNERLVEAELIDLLGVGRTAVRTALVRLAQEGLVVHERNRGARVRYVDETEAVEIVLARAALEALAVRQAAEHATARRRRRAARDPRRDDASTRATCSAPRRRTRCCTPSCSSSRATGR